MELKTDAILRGPVWDETIDKLKDRFDLIDKVAEHNQAKVISAMQKTFGLPSCQLVYKPKKYTTYDAETISLAAKKQNIKIYRLAGNIFAGSLFVFINGFSGAGKRSSVVP